MVTVKGFLEPQEEEETLNYMTTWYDNTADNDGSQEENKRAKSVRWFPNSLLILAPIETG